MIFTSRSWPSWKRSRLYAGFALTAKVSWPAPRTMPDTSRPLLIMSIIAISSANASGLSYIGSGLPSCTIFAFSVTAARMLDQTPMRGCMQ